jgi:carboxypeptidase family protein
VAVTDSVGAFRLPVRTGTYRLTVELPGFATVVRSVNLLLGQIAAIDLQLSPSTVQESVTVTGEAPLIDTQSSVLAGNIDPKQMQELPINGRNWMDLAMLAPGSRQNQSSGVPLLRQGYSQINIDGQQVTNNYIGIGDDQPRFSRDSIAEFEVITNRFDATQGRSAGMIANAITKSGTNAFSGAVGGYFRDAKLNAADKVQNVVLPYQNQQISTTFGGPIIKDRVHFFANYEYEREPQVLVFAANGALSAFNMNIPAPRTQYIWGLKGDIQFSPKNRLSIRGNGYDQEYLSGGGATSRSPLRISVIARCSTGSGKRRTDCR